MSDLPERRELEPLPYSLRGIDSDALRTYWAALEFMGAEATQGLVEGAALLGVERPSDDDVAAFADSVNQAFSDQRSATPNP